MWVVSWYRSLLRSKSSLGLTIVRAQVIVWQEVYNRAADPVKTLGTNAVVDVWKGGDTALIANVTMHRRFGAWSRSQDRRWA